MLAFGSFSKALPRQNKNVVILQANNKTIAKLEILIFEYFKFFNGRSLNGWGALESGHSVTHPLECVSKNPRKMRMSFVNVPWEVVFLKNEWKKIAYTQWIWKILNFVYSIKSAMKSTEHQNNLILLWIMRYNGIHFLKDFSD